MKDMLIVVPFSGTYGNSHFELDWRDDAIEFDEPFKVVLQDFAKAYVPAWNEEFQYVTGIDLHLEYDSVGMPREYNFTNDRIFATMPKRSGRKLLAHAICDEESRAVLDQVCKERHSSRDGFCSFYDPDWRTWKLDELDHNQLETLLIAVLRKEGTEEYKMEQEVMDVSCVREAIENHIVYAEEQA